MNVFFIIKKLVKWLTIVLGYVGASTKLVHTTLVDVLITIPCSQLSPFHTQIIPALVCATTPCPSVASVELAMNCVSVCLMVLLAKEWVKLGCLNLLVPIPISHS